MKILSHLRYLLILLTLPLLLGSCSKKESDAAKPADKVYHIKVRVIAANLSGLGARVDVTSAYDFANANGKYKVGPGVSETIENNMDVVYDLGNFGSYDLVKVKLIYDNVTRTGTVRPAANSSMKAEILVDEVVRATKAQPTTVSDVNTFTPGLTTETAIETDNL